MRPRIPSRPAGSLIKLDQAPHSLLSPVIQSSILGSERLRDRSEIGIAEGALAVVPVHLHRLAQPRQRRLGLAEGDLVAGQIVKIDRLVAQGFRARLEMLDRILGAAEGVQAEGPLDKSRMILRMQAAEDGAE